MNRAAIALLSFWVFLAGPGLCMTGVVQHLCADCPERETCDHEEDCYADPCGVVPLPPDSPNSSSVPVIIAFPSERPDPPGGNDPLPARLAGASGASIRTNLPVPKSDLPLIA
jgi:hypothetical protein